MSQGEGPWPCTCFPVAVGEMAAQKAEENSLKAPRASPMFSHAQTRYRAETVISWLHSEGKKPFVIGDKRYHWLRNFLSAPIEQKSRGSAVIPRL